MPPSSANTCRTAQTLNVFNNEYCQTSGGTGGYYLQTPGVGPTACILPSYMQSGMGDACLNMYLATGQQPYLLRAVQLGNYFKSNITITSGDCAVWNYAPGSPAPTTAATRRCQCSSRTTARAGVVFSQSDMQAICNSVLKSFIYNSSGNVVAWTNDIDGQGGEQLCNGQPVVYATQWTYALLGQIDPAVLQGVLIPRTSPRRT